MLRILLRCVCPHCGCKIDFPADQAGQVMACPKCQKETTLAAPKTDGPSEPVKPERLVVAPRLNLAAQSAPEIPPRIQSLPPVQPRPLARPTPTPKSDFRILKAICSLIGIILVAAAVVFFDQIWAFIRQFR